MGAFLVMITIAPLFWAFTWLLFYVCTRLPLESLWRKILIFIFVSGMMITFGIQGPMVHVGHPHGAHTTAFIWAIAVDCFPALAIGFFFNRDQQKRIEDGRLN
jgi:hypothetical protein